MLYTEERAHFALARVWQAENNSGRPVRICARGSVSAPGDDRQSEAESLQLRRIPRAPFRHRTRVDRDDIDASLAWHIRKCEGRDHLSEIVASAIVSVQPVLRYDPVGGHLASRHARG